MEVTLTDLRSNIFKYFEQVKTSGEPLQVKTKDGFFKVHYQPKKNLKALEGKGIDVFDGDIDELVNFQWPEPTYDQHNLEE